jgi:mannitol operon transcriptional antiterminator
MAHRLPVENALLPEIRQRFPELMDAVTRALAETYPRLAVPIEEVGYLVLHFAASVERHHGEGLPFRALIVCSSGIGTSHMLASRIRAEVPEIEVVANLSWFDVKDFSRDHYDLLISTVPLPLPEADYVVVSPLLDEQGLRTLKDHLRRRRLGLTSQAGFKESPRRILDPVWGEAALSVLMDGLSTPEAKAALAAGDPTELRAVLARILGQPGHRTSQGE